MLVLLQIGHRLTIYSRCCGLPAQVTFYIDNVETASYTAATLGGFHLDQ